MALIRPVALDARTGKRIWHYQLVRHDLWDYDIPALPNLVTVHQGGRNIEALAQVTKTGFVFLFDRATGRPLFDIVERPTAPSDIPGERTAVSQVAPVKPPPFVRQGFTEADITDVSPEAHQFVLQKIKSLRYNIEYWRRSLSIMPALYTELFRCRFWMRRFCSMADRQFCNASPGSIRFLSSFASRRSALDRVTMQTGQR